MWKTVLAATTALVIAGSSAAFAQQLAAADDAAQRPDAAQQWRPSPEDLNAILDGRIAEFKTTLKLSAEQEKNWPAVEQAIRDIAKARRDRIAAGRDQPRPTDLIERLEHRADAMTGAAASLKRLAEAAKPLYQSLDDGQKHRLAFLIHTMGPHRMAFRGPEHDRRGPPGR
jgi:zinc resistance-associated protein